MTGFEPATPATRTRCATKLRYIPKIFIILFCTSILTPTNEKIKWIYADFIIVRISEG